MEEENEDLMLIDPEILKKELVISLPILSQHDIEMMINGVDSSFEESSTSSSDEDKEKEKPCLKRDQRRLTLLNNPDYGVILYFLDKFRLYINIKDYPLRLFEDNLISEHDKISRRLIDFHIFLLKKASAGKNVQRDKFVPSLTRFAYRNNRDDGEHLEEYGYAKARIDIKVRILKSLLEKQFDHNQQLKTALVDEPSCELRSKPFGRDRFGASYWLFMDNECFIRIFRENIDNNRTWIYLAKNRDEFENLIKLLITDHVIRKKFPEWKFAYESYNSLSSSNTFDERYSPSFTNFKDENETKKRLSPSLSSNSSIIFHSDIIKRERIDLDPIVNLSRDLPSSSLLVSPFIIHNIKTEKSIDLTSDQESINSVEINGNRLSIASSNDTRDDIYSTEIEIPTKKSISKTSHDINQVIVLNPSLDKGIKRKLVDYDDSESEIEDNEKNDETSQESQHPPASEESRDDPDLPIALRRPRRARRTLTNELSSTSSSTTQSTRTKRKVIYEKWKSPSQSSKTNSRHQRSRRRRRRGKITVNGFSSTTSDERQPSDDDVDDYNTDEYLPDKTQLDILLNGDLLDEEDDDDDEYVPRHTAKTVAKSHEQFGTPLIACCTCLKNDRPEAILLCEDCDDAYHFNCLRPELLSLPDYDWFCPLCEHKHLCDNLIEKLLVFIKDEAQVEMKHRLYVSKRRKRLTNVVVNLDRYVKQPTNKRRANVIDSSDDEVEQEDNKKKNDSKNDDDDDDDSVYGRKNNENRKPLSDSVEEQSEGSEKRRVRSCRRTAQDYRLDDYDKKMTDAMIAAGIKREELEVDSDESEDMLTKIALSKKCARYEQDDDFDGSDGRNHDDFVPSRSFRITDDDDDDSHSKAKENDDDIGMSDDEKAWKNRRQSSSSTAITKKKSNPTPNRGKRLKSTIVSDDENILSEANLSNLPPAVNVKPEPAVTSDKKEVAKENKRRQRRAASAKKKCSIQQENISDEEEDGRPPPLKRLPNKPRRGSDDSLIADDDDYEKLAYKRRLFHHGKVVSRRSITSHIKKLVGDEEDEDEGKEEEEEGAEGSTKDQNSGDGTKDSAKETKKKPKPQTQYDELQISDDDDFPDEQEILKTTGLLNLKKPVPGAKSLPIRAPFMLPVQSYQYTMVDPTAQFDFDRPQDPVITPSTDTTHTSGANGLPTTA